MFLEQARCKKSFPYFLCNSESFVYSVRPNESPVKISLGIQVLEFDFENVIRDWALCVIF